jgi:phage anti-repressor protein
MCMLVKTDKGKQIRKYYVKLENIFKQIYFSFNIMN